jgi:hypothetical protein
MSRAIHERQNARKGAAESTLERPLVSIILNSLIIGGCNPVLALLSAYGCILHESGPYPSLCQPLQTHRRVSELANILCISIEQIQPSETPEP